MSEERLLRQLIERLNSRFYGKYQGFLVDNQDPQKRGRLRLLIPEILGDVVSGWAEPCIPYGGGKDFGHFSIPEVTKDANDQYTTGIWVEFRGGDVQFPIWVGTFWGAPGGTSEAPGDDAEPDIHIHVHRTFGGHGLLANDTAESERLELRDSAGQRMTLAAPLKSGTRRDDKGAPGTAVSSLDYPDLVNNGGKIELVDFAGNTLLLDSTKDAPVVKITNTTKDGSVLHTIELNAASSDPKITITDQNKNVITLDQNGIKIDAGNAGATIVMDSGGIAATGSEVNLNDGSEGGARKEDKVKSTSAEDPQFWIWMTTLQTWLATHTHVAPLGPTSPPVAPFPGSYPSELTGKIIEGSGTVKIGD